MRTRLNIGLPAAPPEFIDEALGVVNAMRAVRHHTVKGTGVKTMQNGAIVQKSQQGSATFVRDETGLVVAYEPDPTAASGFANVAFRLCRASFPDSILWTCDTTRLIDEFVMLSSPLIERGMLVGYRTGEGPNDLIGILEAPADEPTAEIEALINDLSNGTDVAAGGAWKIRRRWAAFGCTPLVEPVSDEDVVYRTPAENDPNEGRRQAGFRIRLIKRFMGRLPPAVMIGRAADGVYEILPYSLTRQAPESQEDSDAARRRAVQAYHRLTSIRAEEDA